MNNSSKAFVAYLGTIFTGIYFLITEKNNDFVRKNAAQAFTIGAFGITLCIVVFFIPFIGHLLFTLCLFLFIFLWTFSMIKALNKIYYKLPLISDISEKYVVNWFKY